MLVCLSHASCKLTLATQLQTVSCFRSQTLQTNAGNCDVTAVLHPSTNFKWAAHACGRRCWQSVNTWEIH